MDKLIYNQRKIPKEKWRYGLRSSAAVGCGWIAAYNALALMGYRAKPEELIQYFEKQLPLIHGNAGTSILGPAICLKQMGFSVTVTAEREKFDELAKSADACVLFYRWTKPWKYGAHFVALEYKNGQFIGYNTYRNSAGPDVYGESLRRFIKEKRYFGPVLAAVRKGAAR